MDRPPAFDLAFRQSFEALLAWRRDVRRFRPDPLPDGLLDELIALTRFAPSVGLSQPWRFVLVESEALRRSVAAMFARVNARALEGYEGERAALYASLRLAGLSDAPVQIAVFVDTETTRGHGLGRQTMPETLDQSAVLAIHTLWLAARTHGVGLGWVSILDPQAIGPLLDVPAGWRFVGYLCLGYPLEAADGPELERAGWETRAAPETFVLRR